MRLYLNINKSGINGRIPSRYNGVGLNEHVMKVLSITNFQHSTQSSSIGVNHAQLGHNILQLVCYAGEL